MSVYLYTGGLNAVKKSGIGQAIEHQKRVLDEAGLDPVTKPDRNAGIVHINTVFPDSVLRADLEHLRGRSVVYYAHSTMEDFKHSFKGSDIIAPLFKKWIMHCYSHGDVILTPTEYSKQLLEGYGIKKPIYSISNGVDTEFFSPGEDHRASFRRKYDIGENENVVISIGHMIERKGIIDYIELARRLPDVRFFWFGHTPSTVMTDEVRDAIKDSPSNLEFPGFVSQEELRDAYCGADAFVFMSHEETEGIVVLEALACKIPVILRDIPVYTGWLKHGENVYKGRSIDEFEFLVSGVLDGKLLDVTEAGRKTALTRSYASVGEQLKEIYDKEGLTEGTPGVRSRRRFIEGRI